MAHPQLVDDEPIPDLIRGILSDIRTLIREEIALARVEIREQAGHLRTAALSAAIGLVAGVCGGGLLLVAGAIGVADLFNWPVWAGFLALALVLTACAVAMLLTARTQLRQVHAVPERTISTLKENSQWIAKRLSSVRR